MEVLYVDDDGDDRDVFNAAFREADPSVNVTNFSKAKDLLHHLETSITVPDCIFIDINMPLMDGRECARMIRSNEKFSDARVVMYSTSFKPSDVEEFEKQKFQYITKPDRYGQLVADLKSVVSGNRDAG